MARSGGLSRTRLQRMSDVMRGYMERGEVAGVVAIVSRGDEVHVEGDRRAGSGVGDADAPGLALSYRLDDQADSGSGGDDPGRGGAAAAGRPDRPAGSGAGGSPGAPRHRRTGGRHRAGQAADHPSRSPDHAGRHRRGDGAPRDLPDPVGHSGGRPRPGRDAAGTLAGRDRQALWQPAADPPARRALDVPQRLRPPGRADYPRRGHAARGLPPAADLFSVGDEGHSLQCARGGARPTRHPLPHPAPTASSPASRRAQRSFRRPGRASPRRRRTIWRSAG